MCRWVTACNWFKSWQVVQQWIIQSKFLLTVFGCLYVSQIQFFVKILDQVSHTCDWNCKRIFISNKKCMLWCYLQCWSSLTLSWRRPLSYRNQSIDLQSKSMDWFLMEELSVSDLYWLWLHASWNIQRKDRRVITTRSCNLYTCDSFCSETKITDLNNERKSLQKLESKWTFMSCIIYFVPLTN